MSDTKLTISVPDNGTAQGTLGWLSLELHCEGITLGHTKRGRPGAWLVIGQRRMLLAIHESFCGKTPAVRCWPFAENAMTDGACALFGVALTEAAQRAMKEVATRAGGALQQWLDDGDGDDDGHITLRFD